MILATRWAVIKTRNMEHGTWNMEHGTSWNTNYNKYQENM